MAPTIDTITAVTSAVQLISSSWVRRTGTPSEAAESAPKVKASSARRCHRHTARPSTATGSASHTDGQRTPLRLPSSQNRMPRACSAVADLVIRKAVRALNSCDPAIPARITWALLWLLPLARDSKSTKPNAASAPMKAPPDSDSAAPPRPSRPTATAPVEAPADRPSK